MYLSRSFLLKCVRSAVGCLNSLDKGAKSSVCIISRSKHCLKPLLHCYHSEHTQVFTNAKRGSHVIYEHGCQRSVAKSCWRRLGICSRSRATEGGAIL